MHSQSMKLQSATPRCDGGSGSPVNFWKWFADRDQPPRRSFGYAAPAETDRPGEINQTIVLDRPFGALLKFSRSGAEDNRPERRILLVAPLSGHFAFLLRDMVAGLAPHASVYVTDWVNARCAPVKAGDFGFSDNVAYVVEALRKVGPGAHVIAVCQGAIPALAATAILSDEEPELAPVSLTLIAAPVDPLANPTRVVQLLRAHPLKWYRDRVLRPAPEGCPGAGRLVYPASTQLRGLAAYFARHMSFHLELFEKTMNDDGADCARFPFLDLYASVMDLPAAYFLENTELVFHERAAWTGRLLCNGEPIEFGAIRRTALMTIEGERDDIAAPGQTAAAHCLCPRIPEEARRQLVVPMSGHFNLFHGRRWRSEIMPQIIAFMDASNAR
jgi:poly(3-hydroxybutyrate) depolymerase